MEPSESDLAAKQPASAAPRELVWEADVGLLTNPVMWEQWGTLLGGTALLTFLLLSFVMAVQGEWDAIPTVLWVTLLGVGTLVVLLLFVVLVIFRNRFRVRFSLSEKGALFDARAKAGSRLAALLGALGSAPTVAGAGALGMSREREFVSWRGIISARYYPHGHSISLRNRWRTVLFLACTPDNYEQVAAFVRQRIAASAAMRTAPIRNPLPRLLARSALVVLAALPVFLLPYPFELDLLIPLIMLCFALATVWLVPLFGWVVIACAVWIATEIIVIGLEVKESFFASLGTYRNFEVLAAEDWVALAAVAVGLGYLVVTSWRAARGRILSALGQDEAEMGG